MMSGLTRTRRPGEGEASPASKRWGRAAVAPVIVTPVPATGHAPLQRQPHCACGGGCPRCQQGAHPALQTKLNISTPGDPYEQEADHVAEQVMRMTGPGDAASVTAAGHAPDPLLQRKCSACSGAPQGAADEEEETLQATEVAGQVPHVQAQTQSQIDALRAGGGQPLARPEREFFEPRFGHDLGDVRVHTDARAAASARAVSAQAYTVGRDIVFGEGQYEPGTTQGRLLLAHELTHVVQQRGGLSPMVQRRGESRACPMSGVPPTATTPPQRGTSYCSAFTCHQTNPWLNCACTVSNCIPLAIDALRGQGVRGALYYFHLDQVVTPAGHTGSFYKGLAQQKADFYEDVNECFYNNWRLGYSHMYEVGSSPNTAWHNAKNACPIGAEDTRACSDAQVVAEWSPVGCGTGPRSGRAIPFGYDPAWGNSNAFPGFGNATLTDWLTPQGCSFPGITPAQWNNASSQIAGAQSICANFVGRTIPAAAALLQNPAGTINLASGDPQSPLFSIGGLSGGANFQYRWVIADSNDNRYLMWAASGNPFQFGPHPTAYISFRTRELLRSRGVRTATVMCRVVPPVGEERLFSLPVTFTW